MSGKVIASSDIIGVIPAANLPPSGGGAPQGAPYLLNGPDTSGLLTNSVDVLDLATPQPLVATAKFLGDFGAPVSIEVSAGAGSVGDGCLIPLYQRSHLNNRFLAGAIGSEIVAATDGAETTALTLVPRTSGSVTGGIDIRSNDLVLNGIGNKTIATANGDLTLTAAGVGSEVVFAPNGTAVAKATPNGIEILSGLFVFGMGSSIVATAAVRNEDVFDGQRSLLTDGGPASNCSPGVVMAVAGRIFAPTGGAGSYAVNFSAPEPQRRAHVVGARILMQGATSNLDCTVSVGGIDLFQVTGLAPNGGGHMPATATYNFTSALLTSGDPITITAEGATAMVEFTIIIELYSAA